jgi:hypothetical protein
MNELTPRGHLRPLGGREIPRQARPKSRSPRRCLLSTAGRPERTDEGTTIRRARPPPAAARARRRWPKPISASRRQVRDNSFVTVKTGHSESDSYRARYIYTVLHVELVRAAS